MASMNNWLGFSLSPHEDLPAAQSHPSTSIISGDEVSADCYGSFGILEALHRPNHHTHDWSEKGSLDHYKGSSSELSMLVGSSSGGDRSGMGEDQPKLEDFLGGHSFSGHEQKLSSVGGPYDGSGGYMYSNGGASNTGSSIGLSMIKSWLRSQPAQHQQAQQQPQPQGDDGVGFSSDVGSGAIVVTSSQSLSLSMSTGSLAAAAASGGGESSSSAENKQNANSTGGGGSSGSGLDAHSGAIEVAQRKSIDTFGQRTSIYRGVTRHRWTGRYEAHLWDNSCRREGQTRKGRQVYLGGYDKEEKAARAYDLAALKYWGTTTTTNFPISNYEKELEEMKHMTRQEYVASLRRKSSGFSRGASIYRGVTRHHQHGRWQARIGRVAGNKDLYLGTFSTQEEAAEAYDIAAIKFRGLNAVTNFDMSRYDVKSILESSTLPVGGAAKRLKDVPISDVAIEGRRADEDSLNPQLTDTIGGYGASHHGWPAYAFQQAHPLALHYPYGQARGWCKQEQDAVVVAAQSLQDLQQLQLGSNTHNFFQPQGIHNLMSLDSSSLEHSTGSNSVIYNGGVGGSGVGYQVGSGGGYMIPMSTMVVDQGQNGQASSSYVDNDQGKQMVYDGMIGSGDPYGSSRNMYYLSQHTSGSGGGLKDDDYEQGGGCNNWMPSPVQHAIAPRGNNVGVGHGAPLFTVWNDA